MPLRLQPDILPFVLAPGARHRNDSSAAAGTNWRDSNQALPPGLTLQWLGTAGFAITYEGTTLVTDPFLSRAPFGHVARGRPLTIDPALAPTFVPRCDAVLMGHTHFDHALDTPAIAKATGCTVYGSASMTHYMGLHGLSDQAVTVEPKTPYEVGPFVVRFIPSVHSKLMLGLSIPQGGELTCDSCAHMTHKDFHCGQVWGIHIEVAGTSLYHMGSCDLLDDEVDRTAEWFLAGIAGRGSTPRFWERVLKKVQPKVLIPHHYDNFFLPLGEEMGFSLNVNYGSMLTEVRRVDPDLPVVSLDPLQTVGA
ncbi:MAG: MBL fold metallo-hydrolase [Deltaproteobacteria bacterium]|nr:MBL fold metallo-hydrolase [Deltaproteobacteria bacterium]